MADKAVKTVKVFKYDTISSQEMFFFYVSSEYPPFALFDLLRVNHRPPLLAGATTEKHEFHSVFHGESERARAGGRSKTKMYYDRSIVIASRTSVGIPALRRCGRARLNSAPHPSTFSWFIQPAFPAT